MKNKYVHDPCRECDTSDTCLHCELGAYRASGLTPAEVTALVQAKQEGRLVAQAHWALISEGTRCNLVKCTNCGHSVAVANTVPLDEWRAAKPHCDQCGARMSSHEA